MQLYRLCRQKYAELSGYGARMAGGRWNRKGISALYTADSASLAVLEVLVHLDRTELPDDYVILTINVDAKWILPLGSAHAKGPYLDSIRSTGHEALPDGMVGFSAPSAVVPQNQIVVLYPDAPCYVDQVSLGEIRPFGFDTRLFVSRRPD